MPMPTQTRLITTQGHLKKKAYEFLTVDVWFAVIFQVESETKEDR